MTRSERSFVPAAGHDWLLPLYDPLWRVLGSERTTKGQLIEQAGLRPGHRVLDLGCGTGTLSVWAKQNEPDAQVTGVDPDPKALRVAAGKARDAGVSVRFDQGFGDALAYPDASFDRVLSSFMFHHLGPEEKRATLREVRRVLVPQGSLHLVDFGPPKGGRRSLLARVLHQGAHMHDNLAGRIPNLMRDAGFADSNQVADRSSLFGTVAYYRAL